VSVQPEARPHRQGFGIRVRQRRLELGLSQEQLADKAGMHRNYIGGVERGERNIGLDNIHALAQALDVRPGLLVDTATD
jgi:transcriptional regulator with XRE-family HTH domain